MMKCQGCLRTPVRDVPGRNSGVLGPGAFIDALAESTYATAVGRWVIRAACQAAAAWRADRLPLGRIGVNLFPHQAHDDVLERDVTEALKDFGLSAEALELEITENIALNREDTGELVRLHEAGVQLALDDFGTGYASLAYLTRLPLSRIKVDRSFIANMMLNNQVAAIVRLLIAMAHNLDLRVIAEGVETAEQADFLRQEKCEEAQGFLYATPLPAAEFETFLRTRQIAGAPAEGRKARDRFEPPRPKPSRRRRSSRS